MKILQLLFVFFLIFTETVAQENFSFNFSTNGQRVCLVETTITTNPAAITIHFLDASDNQSDPTAVFRRPLYGGGNDWVLMSENITPGTTSWTDTNVNFGEVWEYQIRRISNSGEAIGYTTGTVEYDQSNSRGQMILLVADNIALELPMQLATLQKDLIGDGWYVNLLTTPRATTWDSGAEVLDIKSQITSIYNNAPLSDKPKILFILGHVPLPRSGQDMVAPDDHDENKGARGADAYYADLDGIFTDTATYNPGNLVTDLAINLPGDFKWDQDMIPSQLEMAFGRVDFADLSGLPLDEVALTEQYLERLHRYKQVQENSYMGNRCSYYFGYDNSNDGSFRSLPAITKADSIIEYPVMNNPPNWVKENGPFMIFMQNQIVPDVNQWRTHGMDAVVYSSDQSYWGFGDVPQNGTIYSRIRQLLGEDTKCLVSLWTTTAINLFHQAGMGDPLGYACQQIMDHNPQNNKLEKPSQSWDEPDWWNRMHFAFHGDPTLRLHQVYPPSNLTLIEDSGQARLSWDSSPDERLLGYHVYKSDTELGIYEKISSFPLVNPLFIDPNYQLGNWYMVRAMIKQETGSGTFLNPSQGIFVEGDISLSNQNFETSLQVHLQPNPAKQSTRIMTDQAFEKIAIINSAGQEILNLKIPPTTVHQLDLSPLSAGAYLVKIYLREEILIRKLVKL